MLPVGGRKAADVRVLDSDYFLSREFVDQYAGEVKGSRKGPQLIPPQFGDVMIDEDAKGDEDEIESTEGDPTDWVNGTASQKASTANDTSASAAAGSADVVDALGVPLTPAEKSLAAKIRDTCVSNWKAAANDEKKRMWSIFDECGIFACSCRHSITMWVCDMVRSGERYSCS